MIGDIGFELDGFTGLILIWFVVVSLIGDISSIDIVVFVDNGIGLLIRVDLEGEIGIVGDTFVDIDDCKRHATG